MRQKGQINAAYAPYNAGLTAAVGLITQAEADARKIQFNAGVNPVVIEDESLTAVPGLPKIRHATSADKLPLAAGSVLGKEATPGDPTTIWGVTKALTDQYVVVPAEKDAINTRLAAFNNAIKTKVESNARIAFVDINAALLSFSSAGAAVVNGVTLTPSLAPPTGIYSEDGIHPNSRGYAFISTFIIDAINAKFGSLFLKHM